MDEVRNVKYLVPIIDNTGQLDEKFGPVVVVYNQPL